MEFINVEFSAKKFFKAEKDEFGSQKRPWMIRAVLRPVKNITQEREAKELAAFLNHKMRVALSLWDEMCEDE